MKPSGSALSLLCLLAALAPVDATAQHSSRIRPPLRPETLIQGRFVAYTLLWQVAVPGGDPIVFRADGTVHNARAGLAGRWRIANDSTLILQQTDGITRDTSSREFRLRREPGDLVSPVPVTGKSGSPLFWIRRQGAAAPPP